MILITLITFMCYSVDYLVLVNVEINVEINFTNYTNFIFWARCASEKCN